MIKIVIPCGNFTFKLMATLYFFFLMDICLFLSDTGRLLHPPKSTFDLWHFKFEQSQGNPALLPKHNKTKQTQEKASVKPTPSLSSPHKILPWWFSLTNCGHWCCKCATSLTSPAQPYCRIQCPFTPEVSCFFFSTLWKICPFHFHVHSLCCKNCKDEK